MKTFTTNLERIESTLSTIASFNATPGEGHTRFSYGKEDQQVRDFLVGEMHELGMQIQTDAVGNIRARLEGSQPDLASVMSGSHIDTVLHGGRYDGALGTVAAIEIARVIREQELQPVRPYEVIIFAEEEGSNFGVTTLGSKCLTGECTIDYLKELKTPNGQSAYALMHEFGLSPDELEQHVLKKGEVAAMVELHIEQSIVLENRNIELGIVEEIAGRQAYWVTLTGASGHAGATPMGERHDALVGAAEVIASLEQITQRHGGERTVATAGKIICEPNVSNSIAGQVGFSLDIRDVEGKWMSAVAQAIQSKIESTTEKHQLQYNMVLQGSSDGMYLAPRATNALENTANTLGHTNLRMVSGAVHDAALLAKLTDVGMLFIPSVGGVSHVPHEHSKAEHIQAGCDVLCQTVLGLVDSN